jgi:AAA+ superfamily predicted ATPase
MKFLFCGPPGSGKKSAADAVCRKAGINLLVVDSKSLLEGDPVETAYLTVREALLQKSALYLKDFDALTEDKEPENIHETLFQAFKTFSGLIFLAGKESMEFNRV